MIVNQSNYGDSYDHKESSDKQTLEIISWVAFALTLIPFLPSKLLISAVGIVTGKILNDKYNGGKQAYYANIISLSIRLAFWSLLLFWPLMIWLWTVLL